MAEVCKRKMLVPMCTDMQDGAGIACAVHLLALKHDAKQQRYSSSAKELMQQYMQCLMSIHFSIRQQWWSRSSHTINKYALIASPVVQNNSRVLRDVRDSSRTE